MLASLFLPKEIRDIIAELRSKDDLNEHAKKNFERIIFIAVFPTAFILTLPLLIILNNQNYSIYMTYILYFLLSLLIYRHFSLSTWRRFYAPYLEGKSENGIVKKVLFGGAAKKHCYIQNERDKKIEKIIIEGFSPDWSLIKKGYTLKYIKGENGFSVIFSPKSLEFYCLQKSKLEIID